MTDNENTLEKILAAFNEAFDNAVLYGEPIDLPYLDYQDMGEVTALDNPYLHIHDYVYEGDDDE